MKHLKIAILILLILITPCFGVWDKDKPAATTSLRSSNPEMLENQSVLETAIDIEHAFATGGVQTGVHAQGSARCFSQAGAPATQVGGGAFVAADLGSIWVDTDDNAVYVLTATVPTWTAVSDEVIATLLAANRIFAGTLDVTGTFAALGNATVGGTLDVTGNIDPTSYEATNGGFFDEDTMASNSATAVSSQQAIKSYVDNKSVDGSPTAVTTKYLTGTLDGDATTTVAHGVSGVDNILSVAVTVFNSGSGVYFIQDNRIAASAAAAWTVSYDSTNVTFGSVGTSSQGQKYRIRIDYQ